MTRITGEIVIDAPADVVFDFVADQRNEPAPVLARVGGRQERATWAGLKRYLESSQHAADPGAGEQPGPAPAAAADGNGSQPPGQGWAGAALLAASVAGVALALGPLVPAGAARRSLPVPGEVRYECSELADR